MQAYLNGRIVSEEEALVSVTDRGLLYGDGLFETLRVHRGRPLWWARHWQRLCEGVAFLRLPLMLDSQQLHGRALELIAGQRLVDGVLRLMVTRGPGPRGYSPRGAHDPTIAMTLHPPSPRPRDLRLRTSSWRVWEGDPLVRFKTANKLVSILARAEAEDAGADEALLLNSTGTIATAAAANVFWIEADSIRTPPVSLGALPGVCRGLVLELCRALDWKTEEASGSPQALRAAHGMFLTNSVGGVMPVVAFDDQPVPQSERIARLQSLLQSKEEEDAA